MAQFYLGDNPNVDMGLVPTGGTTGQVLKKYSNSGCDVHWADESAGGVAWGGITGTLSSQTDLQTELNGKAATGHNHDASYEALGAVATHAAAGDPHPTYLTAAEGNAAYAALTHSHPTTDISDSTAFGRSMVTAADAAAGRTALGLGNSATRNVGTLSTEVAAGDAISNHEAAADPHTTYQRESEKGAASGYASLDTNTRVPTAQLGTGTPDTTKFLRGDSSWAAPTAAASWGSITGTLSSQTDLQTALDGKAATSHSHTLADISDEGALAALNTVGTAQIDNDAVTYAKLQNVTATSRFLGRITAGAGDTEELTGTQATTLLDNFTSALKGTVPASGGGTTNFLRADATWAAPSGGGGSFDPAALRTRPFAFTDFIGPAGADTGEASYAAWDLTLISSGTQAKIAGEPDHPGIIRITSSTTANSGGVFTSDVTGHRFNGGDTFEIGFQIRTSTATTHRFGFRDNTTSSDAVDGAYFELAAGSLALVGKTSNNSTRSTTATIATLSLNTWYRARVEVNSAITSVAFTVWNDAGTQLGTQSLTTNIPTAAAREFGHGAIATNSGTVATLLVYYDYMIMWYQSDLTR